MIDKEMLINWYYDSYSDTVDNLIDDYLNTKEKYWESRINAGEVTLEDYHISWKCDSFDDDWRDYISNEINSEFKLLPDSDIINHLIDSLAETCFAND